MGIGSCLNADLGNFAPCEKLGVRGRLLKGGRGPCSILLVYLAARTGASHDWFLLVCYPVLQQ